MQRKALCLAFLLAVVACLSACSKAVPRDTVRRLSEADRASITYYTATGDVTAPLIPEEVRKVIQAISTAKKDNPGKSCAAGLRIDFFKGTNVIGELIGSHDHADGLGFGIDGLVYLDTSGTLKSLDARFRHQPEE